MSLYLIKNIAMINDIPKEIRKSSIIGIIIKMLEADGMPLIVNKNKRKTRRFNKKDNKEVKQALIINISYLKLVFLTILAFETIEFKPSEVLSAKKFHKIMPNNKNKA